MRKKIDLWIDLRSPFSFLATDPAYQLEHDFEVALRLRPFALDIASSVNLSDPVAIARGMRKIKYFYLDARRFANQRGITLLGPKKIFDQTLVHLAWLYADKSNHGRALIDLAFPRFFKREIDYEDKGAIVSLLQDAGVDPAGFDAFAAGEGPAELKRHQEEAESQGVFAVPTFVVDGELFWGQDRIDFVRAKLAGVDGGKAMAEGPMP